VHRGGNPSDRGDPIQWEALQCGAGTAVLLKSRTATAPKVFQIGLYGVVEADLELFCNSWSEGFFGERLKFEC